MKKRWFIFPVFIALLLANCAEEVNVVEFTIPQVERLLTSDDGKDWLRTGYLLDGQELYADECALQTITTFYRDEDDTARYVVRSNTAVCPGTSDTLETGYWEIIGQQGNIDFAETIEFVHEDDTVTRYIEKVTSLYLFLSGTENETSLEITYEAVLAE